MKKRRTGKRNLAGAVKFKAFGGFFEELVSRLYDEGIRVYDIRSEKSLITAKVGVFYYPHVRREAKKYGVSMRIIKREGIYFKARELSHRIGLITGGFACALVFLILSQFIWNIEIIGNTTISDGEILRIMADYGIMPGAYRFGFDTNGAKYILMQELDSLSWASVQRHGSTVRIEVSEISAPEINEPIAYDEPCNIVSDVDGFIVDAKIKRGTFYSAVGNGIHKGQLLVGGAIDDNGGHIIYVHSNAEITAQCEITEIFTAYKTQTKTIPTDKIYKSTYFMLSGYSLPLPGDNFDSDSIPDFTYREDIYPIKLFGLDTPFSYKEGIYTVCEERTITYTEHDLINQLNKQITDYKDNFLSDCKIIEVTPKISSDDDKITAEVKFTVQKQIGVKEPVTYFS